MRSIQISTQIWLKVFPILLILSGCGYRFQKSYSPVLEKEGIRRIFIAPVLNNSYQPGVENLIFNVLQKKLATHRWIVLVRSPEEADAILQGTVQRAQFSMEARTRGDQLPRSPGAGGDFSKISVASVYQSQLECQFSLTRRNPPQGKPGVVWSATFHRTQPFPGANQLGALGTTSALINSSEFERSLQNMAQDMTSDIHESILNRF